jgi:sec-independent protein translocase protein TatA
MLGTKEIVILVGVLVLLFGAKKIPELARSLGQSVGYLKKGLKDGENGVIEKDKK